MLQIVNCCKYTAVFNRVSRQQTGMPLTNHYFWQEIEGFGLSSVVCIVYDGLLTTVI